MQNVTPAGSIPAAPAITADEFFARARARLGLDIPVALHDLTAPATRGDLDYDPTLWELAGGAAKKPAAVLIPVVDRPEPAILFTERTPHLPSHPGQIAFPGGKIDPLDESPLEAAIREAQEEVGLDRSMITPIGYLDLYLTLSGYRILPLLARIDPDHRLSLNRSEVADAFEVPLAFLMEPGNHQFLSRDWNGVSRAYFAMPYGGRNIWGVTAGILRNLYERIYLR